MASLRQCTFFYSVVIFFLTTPHAKSSKIDNIPSQNMVAFFNGDCEDHICESDCVPWNGGYVCQCPEGKTLKPNGFSCTDIPKTVYKTSPPSPTTETPLSQISTEKDELLQKDEVYIETGEFNSQSDAIDSNKSKLSDVKKSSGNKNEAAATDSLSASDLLQEKVDGEKENKTSGDIKYYSYDLRDGVPDPEQIALTHDRETRLRIDDSDGVSVQGANSTNIEVEVQPEECLNYNCQNGGQCVVREGKPRCNCPLGTRGKRCGKAVEVRFPKFTGSSYLAFPVLKNAYKDFTITIKFKPQEENGVIMFSSEKENAEGDFFSISIIDGLMDFRFDCGTGMAIFKSQTNVTLREWNTVWAQRVDNHGWLKLNQELPIEAMSKGNYTRITLREDLYLGGYRHVKKVGVRVGTDQGFVGCVDEMWVNSYKYDMRKTGAVGDAIHGLNVDECSHNICGEVQCSNEGECVVRSADKHICLCPLGTDGPLCENKLTIHVPSFSGHSFLRYEGLGRTTLTYTEIEVILKPQQRNGLILYNGYTADRKGDFIALVMREGHIEFSFDLGTGPATLRSLEPVTLDEWHIVRVYRTGMDGVLYVDDQEKVEGLSKGAYTQLTLLLSLFVGGHENLDHVSKHVNMTESFKGCMQKVVINEKPLKLVEEANGGVNVGNCEHPCVGEPCVNGGVCIPEHGDYHCLCPLGYTNTNCEDIVGEPITVPKFQGSSYLKYTNTNIIKRVVGKKIDIQMNVRATGEDGLLFWSGQEPFTAGSDYLALGFNDGFLQFRYNLGSGEVIVQHNTSELFNGNIHAIRAQRVDRNAYLSIDGTEIYEATSPGKYKYLNTNNLLYLGGVPDVAQNTRRKFTSGLQGCIYKLVLGTDYEVNLIGQADSGQNMEQCP